MPAGPAACDSDVMPTSTRTITAETMPRVARFIRVSSQVRWRFSATEHAITPTQPGDFQVVNSPPTGMIRRRAPNICARNDHVKEPNELRVAEITAVARANAYLREHFIPDYT